MRVLLSGEGPTDLGNSTNAQGFCRGGDFRVGPMTVLVSQISVAKLGYDFLTTPDSLYYVSESELSARAKLELKRSPAFRGKKLGVETRYYFDNAMMLGRIAQTIGGGDDPILVVLFRDSDGTRSSPGSLWIDKWQSMCDGFLRAGFEHGVPMLPKPKSEAWLLSGALPNMVNCAALEDIPGNDNVPNSAKDQLYVALGGDKSASDLCDWLTQHPLDVVRASSMHSFKKFKDALDSALDYVML